MVDRHLMREFNIDEAELDAVISASFPDFAEEDIYHEQAQTYDLNQILTGTIVRVDNEEVVVDIGYKSEGVVQRDEWDDIEPPPEVGQQIEVLLEEFEDSIGLIVLSKRKAGRIREWEKIIQTHAEGDVVKGQVIRKIKGGLLINIGVNVFLPASQVDIRRPNDIAEYIGQEIECMILKIDEARKNIVVSRRRLIEEEEREKMKKSLLSTLQVGQLRKGTVKNIADFGARRGPRRRRRSSAHHGHELGSHQPSNRDGQDRRRSRSDGFEHRLRQRKDRSGSEAKVCQPMLANISTKYPVGSRISGEVVNVLSYGAFVKLEDGIEGLVHISEMSWTRRVNHPSELVAIGDKVEVMVLGINEDKQEISLGMKQTQPNPWDEVAAKYPPGTIVKGTVRNLTNYGAFVELQEGVDGLLHISDMSWTRKVSHANEILKKGDPIECQILSVDEDRRRIALGLKQLAEDPWETRIPEKYAPGKTVTGKVTKITNFGVFVQLEDDLEGLLHVSELADHKVEHPENMVQVGQDLEVRILRVDTGERKIGLSRKTETTKEAEETESDASAGSSAPAKPREELKGGTGSGAGPLFSLGGGDDK